LFLQDSAGIETEIRPRLLPSAFFTCRH
jgi:hypothetical protein